MIYTLLYWLNEFARGAEYLHLVVFGGGHHDPGVVLVPVEIADAVGEAAVHEESRMVSVYSLFEAETLVTYSSGGPSSASSSVCSAPIMLRSHMQIRRS
jgi:hypothetical protein